MLALALSSTLGAPLSATAPPTFAEDYYVGQQSNIDINQGGYRSPSGGFCCDLHHTPQCKVQQIIMGEDMRQQGSHERVRSDSAHGAVVVWWGKVKKQMSVVPGAAVNSTHKWACAAYCPEKGEYHPQLQIGDGHGGKWYPLDTPHDMGKATITQPQSVGGATKETEHWRWTETLLHVVPMQTTDFYVDMSTTPASPFFQTNEIKPFNRPVGFENVSYLQYKPMDVSEYFDLDPVSVSNCTMSKQCNQNQELRALSPTMHAHVTFAPTLYEAVQKALKDPSLLEAFQAEAAADAAAIKRAERLAALTAAGKPYPMPNVTFATDFVATEVGASMINQGGHLAANGDPCCSPASGAPQCQIQTSAFNGKRYFDYTNSRERFEDAIENEVTVDDYTVHMSMKINVTDGVETCEEFCPIDKQDSMRPFNPFDPFDKVMDMGEVTVDGKTAEHYRWSDKILKYIPMQTTDFYADISNPKAAVPLKSAEAITPLGRKPPIGFNNRTWSGWTSATPPADKFKIAGVKTCPESNKCQSQSKQAHRMRTGQLHTFLQHLTQI